MRLYDPVLAILKGTVPDRPTQLSLEGGRRTVTIPGDTSITVNINAIHSHPRYWGKDSFEWRPSRWITTDDGGAEQLLVPAKGVYQPWSDGIRACPGKKFAQAEHVALMALLFRDHAVEPARKRGETAQRARERALREAADSEIILNLQMKHPERVPLVWRRR